MFGRSYPEAQIGTWMSYDTGIQNILQEKLKKLIMEAGRKLMRNNRLFNRDLNAVQSDDHIPIPERKWEDIIAKEFSNKCDLGFKISTIVGKLVCHEHRSDREADGAIHWIRHKLKFTFTKQGEDTFTDKDWINHIWKGTSKTRFQYCQNSCDTLLKIRAIERHTGRDVIEPELMGHVATLFDWKQFLFHRRCSFNLESILEAGLIAG